jgi:TRAP-type C4-dicarboxylate transport system substrate-binding protein
MKLPRRIAAGLLSVLLFACGASCAAVADTTHLTIATGLAPTVPTNWWFAEFIGPKLKEYSHGQIDPNVQVNATLCSEHKCVEQAKLGQIDIGSVSAGNIGAFGPTFDILNLPYIFKDDASAEKLINGWLGDELAKRAEAEMDLHVIAIIPSYSFRNIDNAKREIRVPTDMKGIKFRVTKTAVESALISGWGGIPVPYDWDQLYSGLQSGIVNGMYIPDAYVAAQRFYEVTRYITQTGGGWNAHIIFMAKKRYDALSPTEREIIDRIGAEIKASSFRVDREWMARQDKLLQGKVQIYKPTPPELQLWYAGAPPAWAVMKGRYDAKLVRRALVEQGQDALIKQLESAGAL